MNLFFVSFIVGMTGLLLCKQDISLFCLTSLSISTRNIDFTYGYQHSACFCQATFSVCVHLFVSFKVSKVHAVVNIYIHNIIYDWITSIINAKTTSEKFHNVCLLMK